MSSPVIIGLQKRIAAVEAELAQAETAKAAAKRPQERRELSDEVDYQADRLSALHTKLHDAIQALQISDAKYRAEMAELQARERLANIALTNPQSASTASLSSLGTRTSPITSTAVHTIKLTPIVATNIHQDWDSVRTNFLREVAPEQDQYKLTLLLSKAVENDGDRMNNDVANHVPFDTAWNALVARHRLLDWQLDRASMLRRTTPREGESIQAFSARFAKAAAGIANVTDDNFLIVSVYLDALYSAKCWREQVKTIRQTARRDAKATTNNSIMTFTLEDYFRHAIDYTVGDCLSNRDTASTSSAASSSSHQSFTKVPLPSELHNQTESVTTNTQQPRAIFRANPNYQPQSATASSATTGTSTRTHYNGRPLTPVPTTASSTNASN